jgi:hypothetical protein
MAEMTPALRAKLEAIVKKAVSEAVAEALPTTAGDKLREDADAYTNRIWSGLAQHLEASQPAPVIPDQGNNEYNGRGWQALGQLYSARQKNGARA